MTKDRLVQISRPQGIYGKLILRLKEIEKTEKFTEWATVYEKLCRGFSLKKVEIRETLMMLRDFGFIEVSPKGIKLKFEVKDE